MVMEEEFVLEVIKTDTSAQNGITENPNKYLGGKYDVSYTQQINDQNTGYLHYDI